MKLLFLCKRRPQGRDLLTRPYGRFYHLPRLLARQGHEVTILLGNYKREPDQYDFHDGDRIRWYSVSLAGLNPFHYYRTARNLARDFGPDWIIGFSDTWYGILASHLAPRCGCRSLIDAYDNYESYMPWCKPLHYLWRRALAGADMVTAAGPQLAELMRRNRKDNAALILPMAADPEFIPLNQFDSRKKLKLPQHKKLIGYCGSLHMNRGIEFLFQLADRISSIAPEVKIVVSGRKGRGVVIPENIHWLGYLPDGQMPALLNSMDVLLVLNQESSFGKYSYPVKLYEAIQCRVPVVASDTEPVRWILGEDQRFLARVGDLDEFSVRIISALSLGRTTYNPTDSWENVAMEMEKILGKK